MRNPLDWDYLSSVPDSNAVFGPLALGFLAIVIAVLVAGAYFYIIDRNRYREHRVKFKVNSNLALGELTFGAVGVILFAMRIVQMPFLGWRLWMWVLLGIAVLFALYGAYYVLRVYPGKLEEYESSARKRKYMPSSAPTVREPSVGRSERKRKRKKK
jgi:hypothetical protein